MAGLEITKVGEDLQPISPAGPPSFQDVVEKVRPDKEKIIGSLAKVTKLTKAKVNKLLPGAQAQAVGADKSDLSITEDPRTLHEIATEEPNTDTEQDLEDQQKIAMAIIGLAPILLGAAAGGLEGGAIGAKAGQKGLGVLTKSEEERQEREELLTREEKLAKQKAEGRESEREFIRETNLQKQQAAKELEELKQAGRLQAKAVSGKKKVPKASQFEAGLFSKRLLQAEQVFSELKAEGFDPTSASAATQRAGLFPEALKSQEQKRQDQAERNFVNAILRRESGAAIAPSEFESAEVQYFPRVGDGSKVLEQKRVNRMIAIQSMRAEAGEAIQAIEETVVPSLQAPQQAGVQQRQGPSSRIDQLREAARQKIIRDQQKARTLSGERE